MTHTLLASGATLSQEAGAATQGTHSGLRAAPSQVVDGRVSGIRGGLRAALTFILVLAGLPGPTAALCAHHHGARRLRHFYFKQQSQQCRCARGQETVP
jgi:hypothetical protein